jgi:hypothetical protein
MKLGEGRRIYAVVVGKPEGKRLLRRLRCRLNHNIKINLIKMGWDGVH